MPNRLPCSPTHVVRQLTQALPRSSCGSSQAKPSQRPVAQRRIIKMTTSTVQVNLKFRVGQPGEITSFYILLYNDEFETSLYERWLVHVHSYRRVDVVGLLGQTTSASLFIPGGEHAPRSLRCFSSHPDVLQLPQPGPFGVAAGSLCEIPIRFTPVRTERQDFTVHCVDEATQRVYAAWLVSTITKTPPIAKQFEVRMLRGHGSKKRFLYGNPYGVAKDFVLKTNCPSLLEFTSGSVFTVPAHESVYISLKLLPVETQGMAEILIFVNDRDDKNEECICVRCVYV